MASGGRGARIRATARYGRAMASTTVEIARQPDEVFAFVTDPTKLSAWQDAEEVQQLTEGPVRAETRFREIHKVMGRRRVEPTEVVKCDPGSGRRV